MPAARASIPGTTATRANATATGASSAAPAPAKSFLTSKELKHTPSGCQVDHVVPLAKGGKDDPSNMQLLCGEELKAKERAELH
jgi:HNH endonuclease